MKKVSTEPVITYKCNNVHAVRNINLSDNALFIGQVVHTYTDGIYTNSELELI